MDWRREQIIEPELPIVDPHHHLIDRPETGHYLLPDLLADQAIEYYRKALEMEPEYHYAWHDLFSAYAAMARRGLIDLDAMRMALQRIRETSAGSQPGTQVPGLDLEYLKSLETCLHDREQRAAEYPRLLAGRSAVILP